MSVLMTQVGTMALGAFVVGLIARVRGPAGRPRQLRRAARAGRDRRAPLRAARARDPVAAGRATARPCARLGTASSPRGAIRGGDGGSRPPAARGGRADDYTAPRRRSLRHALARRHAPRRAPGADLAARPPAAGPHLRVAGRSRLPLVLHRDAWPQRDDEHAAARSRVPRVRAHGLIRGAGDDGAVPVRGDARLLPLRRCAGRPQLEAGHGADRRARGRRDRGPPWRSCSSPTCCATSTC